ENYRGIGPHVYDRHFPVQVVPTRPAGQADPAGRFQTAPHLEGHVPDRAGLLQVGVFQGLDEFRNVLGGGKVLEGVDQPRQGRNGERHAVVAADQGIYMDAQADRVLLIVRVLDLVADEAGVEKTLVDAGGDLLWLLAGHDFEDLANLHAAQGPGRSGT